MIDLEPLAMRSNQTEEWGSEANEKTYRLEAAGIAPATDVVRAVFLTGIFKSC
jgi:hypothetical protein